MRHLLHLCLLFTSVVVCLFVYRLKKEECIKLLEEIDLYKQTITAKDHIVMELTNKVIKQTPSTFIN